MTVAVNIAKNVYGGEGLGRLGDGRVIFVPEAWAGEQVKAEITEEKRHFVRARLVEVLDPSPDRLASDKVGAVVPGMVYAGISYPAELRIKEEQLRDFFERARIAIPTTPILATTPDEPCFNYRNKVVYHYANVRGKWLLGYRLEPSHEIVDVTYDPLAVKPINDALAEVRRSVMTLLTQGPMAVRRDIERQGNVTIRWSSRAGVKWWVGDAPKDVVIKETTCGKVFEVPADGFYQVNPPTGEKLVAAVQAAYRRDAAIAPNVLDLYCGVGVFGLCLEPPKLIGVESGRQAVAFAQRNAASQGRMNARFFSEQVAPNRHRIPIGAQTTVVVDPPRGGLESGVAKWLAASAALRIFYVSCDPATLMRDLGTLCRNYAVEEVKLFDMFPRTARFETFVALRRKA